MTTVDELEARGIVSLRGIHYFVHDASGEIVRTGTCPRGMLRIQNRSGETALEGMADDATQYYDVRDKVLRQKPVIEPVIDKEYVVADGIDEISLSGLPVPCVVHINGEDIPVDDGSLELSIDQPGVYRVRVSAKYHIQWRGKIEARAQS